MEESKNTDIRASNGNGIGGQGDTMDKEPDMFDTKMAVDSIKASEKGGSIGGGRLEPDTADERTVTTQKAATANNDESVNINVAASSQFDGVGVGAYDGVQNADIIDMGGEQRPKTAPTQGATTAIATGAADDWPATNKDDQISRLSQQMKRATQDNLLSKQYQSKKVVSKAVKAATADSKQTMNDVRVLFNAQLARVYQPATHKKAVLDCQKMMEQYAGNREFVRVAISVLTDKSLVVSSSQVMSKALHAALFGYLGEKFEKSLIYPVDKPASLRKTFDRILSFLIGTFFNEQSEEIAKGCAISMKELLVHCFPEYLEPANATQLNLVFLKPLTSILRGTGQNKNAVASACFCLRYLVQHLIQTKPELVTQTFAAKFPKLAIKRNLIQTNFVELLRDLMRFFGIGVSSIAPTNGKQLFEYSINAIAGQMQAFEQRGGHLFGNQLQDVTTLLKFQKNLVDGSQSAAKFIIAFHYADAMKALDAFRLIKNSTVQMEVTAVKSAWSNLKLSSEAQDRDEILSKFSSKISSNLTDRVNHAEMKRATTVPSLPSTTAAKRESSRSLERNRTLAQAAAITKLSERREQARSAKRATSAKSAASGRSGVSATKSATSVKSGKSGSSAKVGTRKVNVGGQAMLSKSSKAIESKLLKDGQDLTRMLRPGLQNYTKKGEGAGGGAKPTVEKERSIGISPQSFANKAAPSAFTQYNPILGNNNLMKMEDTLERKERSAVVNRELDNIKRENSQARSKSRTASEPRSTTQQQQQPPQEEIKFAFGQRVKTAAKQAPVPSASSQPRSVSRGREEPSQKGVTFEPSSILKKESSIARDADQANLVAVSDPAAFQFDDELEPADQGQPPMMEEESKTGAGMRNIQSRQNPTVFADSLDPRRTNASHSENNNTDLAYNQVYSDKDKVMVDFGQSQSRPSQPQVFPPQNLNVLPPQPVAVPQPQQPQQAVMDTQFLTNMMKTHVKLMQKQLEDGFGLISNKMGQLETRLNQNDKHIKKVETGFVKETETKVQAEQENRQLFERLQESIALQQQSMLQFIDKADQEIKKVNKKVSQSEKVPELDIDQLAEAIQKKQQEANLSNTNMVVASDNDNSMAYQNQALGAQTLNQRLDENRAPNQQSQHLRQGTFDPRVSAENDNVNFEQQQHQQPCTNCSQVIPALEAKIASLQTQVSTQSKSTSVYLKANDLVRKKEYAQAYRLMLEQGDDLYLLRLVVQTGPVTKYLDKISARKVLSKLNKFVRSSRFELLAITWINDSQESGLFCSLTEGEQNEYLDTLYHLQRSTHNQAMSGKAKQVYDSLRKDIETRMAVTSMMKQQKRVFGMGVDL